MRGVTTGGCPPWCTNDDCDGSHQGDDRPAATAQQAIGETAGEPLQVNVAPMLLEDVEPCVFVSDGEGGNRDLGFLLPPDEARQLARALGEVADLVDPPGP